MGGVQRVTANKVNALVEMGEEVYIITLKTDKPSYYPLHDNVKVLYLDVSTLNMVYLSGRIKKHWGRHHYKKRYIKKLGHVLCQLKADIVIYAGGPGARELSTIKDGSVKVYELHGSKIGFEQRYKYPSNSLFWDLFIKIKSSRFRRILFKYDCVVYLTRGDQNDWNLPLSRTAVIPNSYVPKTNECALLENKEVIAVGRYVDEKNFSELIDIWSFISKKYPNWVLKIYGDGYLKGRLFTHIQTLGLSQQVLLKGSTTHIEDAFLTSSIVVQTSLSESFGMALLEAKSLGVPAVSYDTPNGPREIIIDGKDGFLIPMHDKEQFAEKLMFLMRDEELRKRMGIEAKENAKRFHSDVVMSQWMELFHKLMSRKSR